MISKSIVKLVRSLDTKKNRRKEGLFVAEGPKVVGDLMRLRRPSLIIATEEWLSASCQAGTKAGGDEVWPHVIHVTEEELRKISFLTTPQQVLALFPIPTASMPDAGCIAGRLSLVLDGVQDPGNLGTIIRIADWFGISDIFCSMDTADLYNPKVVQATMGSIA
ncbi:MAG: TrmH family RNA methyltransferase, partial [Prevotella sp.]|nr:TrmH family RNA methyltransferase [Prevotella sp.]